MTDCEQHAPCPASAAQFCRFWSAHVDALDRHLSAKTLSAVPVVVMVYPIARLVIPAAVHGLVLDMVRTVLRLV
jgi:hypothetical protein